MTCSGRAAAAAVALNTHPADGVTVFNVNWQGTRAQIEAVVPLLMQDLDGAPEGFGSRFSLAAPSRGVNSFSINLIGQFHGSRGTVDQVLSRSIRMLAPVDAKIEEMSYWNGQDFLEDSDPPFRFHERSAFLPRSLNAGVPHSLRLAFEVARGSRQAPGRRRSDAGRRPALLPDGRENE
jgi:hypothetical protein